MLKIANQDNRVFGKEQRTYVMGVAILYIVLFHIFLWYEMGGDKAPFWIALFREGYMGVDVFFFLSAYGLQASFERNSLWRFYLNRTKRLYPVYLLFLAFVFLVFQRDCSPLWILVQCLFQMSGGSLFTYAHFFSTGFCFDWFTPAITSVYMVFPLISIFARWLVKSGIYAELVTLLLLVIVTLVIRTNIHMVLSMLVYRAPIILLGVLSFLHLKRGEVEKVMTLYVCTGVMGLFCGEKAMMLSLFAPSLLMVFAESTFRLPLYKFVSMVGRHSFEIYLAHIFPVAFLIPMRVEPDVVSMTIMTIVLTVVLATLFAYSQIIFYKVCARKNRVSKRDVL